MTATVHGCQVEPTTWRGRPQHQAVCDCGEAGPLRDSEAEAENDAHRHVAQSARWANGMRRARP